MGVGARARMRTVRGASKAKQHQFARDCSTSPKKVGFSVRACAAYNSVLMSAPERSEAYAKVSGSGHVRYRQDDIQISGWAWLIRHVSAHLPTPAVSRCKIASQQQQAVKVAEPKCHYPITSVQ